MPPSAAACPPPPGPAPPLRRRPPPPRPPPAHVCLCDSARARRGRRGGRPRRQRTASRGWAPRRGWARWRQGQGQGPGRTLSRTLPSAVMKPLPAMSSRSECFTKPLYPLEVGRVGWHAGVGGALARADRRSCRPRRQKQKASRAGRSPTSRQGPYLSWGPVHPLERCPLPPPPWGTSLTSRPPTPRRRAAWSRASGRRPGVTTRVSAPGARRAASQARAWTRRPPAGRETRAAADSCPGGRPAAACGGRAGGRGVGARRRQGGRADLRARPAREAAGGQRTTGSPRSQRVPKSAALGAAGSCPAPTALGAVRCQCCGAGGLPRAARVH